MVKVRVIDFLLALLQIMKMEKQQRLKKYGLELQHFQKYHTLNISVRLQSKIF